MLKKKNIKDQKLIAGVVGCPVSHSLSPDLHNYWLKKHNINGQYDAYDIKPEKLAEFIKTMGEKNMIGLNLTVPHKETIFPFLDDIDKNARKIGAVNTIVCRQGRLYGSNTDNYGFLANLKAKAPEWRGNTGPVVIIGAGGAARAVIVSLLNEGVKEIRLVNRTRARAEKLKQLYQNPALRVCDWQKRSHSLSGAALLVNTTLLGMTGQPSLDMDLTGLPEGAIVYDIVYNPLETPLLKQARARGNPGVDGLGMLLYQAVPAFQAWFGQKVIVDEELRHYMIARLVK